MQDQKSGGQSGSGWNNHESFSMCKRNMFVSLSYIEFKNKKIVFLSNINWEGRAVLLWVTESPSQNNVYNIQFSFFFLSFLNARSFL